MTKQDKNKEYVEMLMQVLRGDPRRAKQGKAHVDYYIIVTPETEIVKVSPNTFEKQTQMAAQGGI